SEQRRAAARAHPAGGGGARVSPIGARRSRNWSDRKDFQERTDIEPCGWSSATTGGPCSRQRQRDEDTRVAAQSSGASTTGVLRILLASSCQASSASSANRTSRQSAGALNPASRSASQLTTWVQ